MQKYEHYVLVIVGFIVFIIAVFNIITIMLRMITTYKEGFETSEINLYDSTLNITDDVRLAIEQNMYNRQLLNKKDKDITSFEEERIGAEKAEFGKRDIDCDYEWSAWGECNASCYQNTSGIAEGEQMRTLRIKAPRQRKGKPCPDNEPKKQKCITTCNVDCKLDRPLVQIDCKPQCDGISPNATKTISEKYNIKVKPQNEGKKCNNLKEGLICDDKTCTDTVTCSTSTCPVDCVGSWSDWSSCGEGKCDESTGRTSGRKKTRTYKITRDAQYGGKQCEAGNGQVDSWSCDTDCAVDCKGYWNIEPDYLPSFGCRIGKYTKTQNALNGGKNHCLKTGEHPRCALEDANNVGLVINDHCIQTKCWNGCYEGNPADDWPLVLWWHEPNNGKKCYNKSRFRVNFLKDGRIQSVNDNSLYLGVDDIDVRKPVKWKKVGATWFINKDNKLELSRNGNANGNGFCLSNFDKPRNNVDLSLRLCNMASQVNVV